MPDPQRMPPSRASRLWFAGRLKAARAAVDLLDRKLRILRLERQHADLEAQRTAQLWHAAWPVADTWGTRAALLAGRPAVRLATPPGAGEVTVLWTVVMGARYPASASYQPPPPSAADPPPSSAAVVEAAAAYRTAVAAAVAHAAALCARRKVDAEVTDTQRRRRAIADRVVPRMEAALAGVNAAIEESERAETIRLRWARTRSGSEA